MKASRDPAAFQSAPALRLLAALGGTALTVLALACDRPANAELRGWARRILKRLRIQAVVQTPVPAGGQLWVANHLSWLDPVIFLSLRGSGALAKAEVAAYPLIGAGARKAGLRFVDRERLASRAAALYALRRDLRAGKDFLLFPEGTTTAGETLAPLREGGLRMAYRLGVTVLPFRLAGADAHYPWIGDDELLGHLQALAAAGRTRVTVHPGTVLDPAGFPEEDSFVAAIRDHLDPGRHPALPGAF